MPNPQKLVKVIRFPGLVSYETTWRYMKALCEYKNRCRKEGKDVADYLLLLQHKSVYTLGKGGSTSFLQFPSSSSLEHEVYRVERGGEVTWHGPGQLVAYPILDLNLYKKDLHWYATNIEESVIQTVKKFGIDGARSAVNTGVWVGKDKLSAVGISATRWITYHGCSINVDCDMNYFKNIVPCGIASPDRGVCKMQDLMQRSENGLFSTVQEEYIGAFEHVFDVKCANDSIESLNIVLSQYPDIESSQLSQLNE